MSWQSVFRKGRREEYALDWSFQVPETHGSKGRNIWREEFDRQPEEELAAIRMAFHDGTLSLPRLLPDHPAA